MKFAANITLLFLITIFLADPSFAQSGAARDFAGIHFGVGVSLTRDHGARGRISGAVLDENGIVRVTEDKNDIARVMLESHYFFEPNTGGKSFLYFVEPGKWGHGPFVALQPGTDEIIEAMGLGWMIGFRRQVNQPDSWNIGFGYVVDPSVQVLAGGVVKNKPLPVGETQIRFRTTSQSGYFMLVSFNF